MTILQLRFSSSSPPRRLDAIWAFAVLLTLLAPTVGHCQVVAPRPVWAFHDPATATSANIRAQATLIRAYGDAAVDFAAARKLHLEAESLETDLFMKSLRAFHESKRLHRKAKRQRNAEKLIDDQQRLNQQKNRNKLRWERLSLHPELVGDSINNGVALNFLLQRLSTAGFEPTTTLEDNLTPELLAAIQFRLPGARGERLVVGANGINDLGWPYALRAEKYRDQRASFQAKWDNLLGRADDAAKLSVEELEALDQSLVVLTLAYYRNNDPVEVAKKGPSPYFQMQAGRRFLENLDRQVQRLKTVGDLKTVRAAAKYDPSRDGNSVPELLEFMMQNGVEFAPPKPGYEHLYRRLFFLTRDYYLGVQDEDRGTQPKDLTNELGR